MVLTKNKSITVQELYNKIHPYYIFKFYCTNWGQVDYNFNKNFQSDSDLRPGDKNPSARLTVSSRGNIYYIDYGENVSRTAIDFVMDKFNISFMGDAIDKIYKEVLSNRFCNTIPTNIEKINKKIESCKHTSKVISIKSSRFNPKDLFYWGQFGWSLELLKKANIVPISKFWVNCRKFLVREPAYCFNYYEHEGIFRRKIYFPFRETNRFVSNIDNTIVQGWNLLPKSGGDTLMITKAFKDVGTFMSIGIYACATNNETSFFPEKVVDKLKSRWKNIYIWWDNDKEGMRSGQKYADKYNLSAIHNNPDDPKDPSDYYKEKGKKQFIQLVNEKL